ncbi:peptidase S8/S53 domain-containing protein [Mycena floridula]|nr:peptidase S8/S53 domain-containing protein [Mycena floridula]
MLALSTLCFAFLLSFTTANPVRLWDDLTVKHAWTEPPPGWQLHSEVSPDHVFEMRLGLKHGGEAELVNSLHEVSDPDHSRYGQHLSKEQLEDLIRPTANTVEMVESWLRHHGIDVGVENAVREGAGSWIITKVTVAQAETLLGAKYRVYSRSSDRVVRALSYSIPRSLHDHIDVISPTTFFGGETRTMKTTSFLQPLPIGSQKLAVGADQCDTRITPACLRKAYNMTSYTAKATNKNKLGIAGFLKQWASYADLETFFSDVDSTRKFSNFTTIEINDGENEQDEPGPEANLDIQYGVALADSTPTTFYSTGGSPSDSQFKSDSFTPDNTNEPYLEWLNYLLKQPSSEIPQTLSVSYGDNEQTVPKDYAQKVCSMFMQLGAMGKSVLFASGDSGVGGGDCKTNDGHNATLLQPAFPASCPWITAVGGTTNVTEEVAASFSGGGFSQYFPRPDYQKTQVESYLKGLPKSNPNPDITKYFNTKGRAYPDISAQAQSFEIVMNGRTSGIGGTSAAAPTVAGIVTLLNDYRLSRNMPPLGFLNPLLYKNPGGFRDIVKGSNPGCFGSKVKGTFTFNATKGWDPVTGLGTPNFGKLMSVV